MPTVTPFLWFTEGAKEAHEHYSRIFGVGQPDGASGHQPFFSATLRIGDTEMIIFNGGPNDPMSFNPSISMFVICDDQGEVDRYWDGLCEGGEPGRCGWLTDKFGVTWQIIPRLFNDLMASPDPAVRERVMAAMMQMDKFDCAALTSAAKG